MKRITFEAKDGKKISMAVWDEVDNPIGVLQLVHGMSEHIGRYDQMARYMNEAGIVVAGDDHRAHGETDREALGKAGEGDLFEKTVRDELDITAMLRDKYNLPLVLFGHSYGSFLTQRYLTIDPAPLKGCVLCGSAFMRGPVLTVGSLLADIRSKRNRDAAGSLFAKMTFASYDKKIGEGACGWLNRDKAEVEAYKNDPLCNFTCSNGFYKYFFKGLKTIASADLSVIPDALPMLIVSGSDDFVGGRGKLVVKLGKRYRKAGLRPEMRMYPGARHELMVETCREIFFSDVKDFVLRCVKAE